MDERLRFVARLLEGENMSRVCREFGISRPTGYKIFSRYKDLGYQGLLDRSRRPYRHANRPYRDPELPQYPFHDRTVCVTRCGRICIGKRKINLSQVFSGQLVGIREVEEKIWLVSFLDFDLGYFDEKEGRVEPGPNPFEAKVLTMSSV